MLEPNFFQGKELIKCAIRCVVCMGTPPLFWFVAAVAAVAS
jgi:hypothetical protein